MIIRHGWPFLRNSCGAQRYVGYLSWLLIGWAGNHVVSKVPWMWGRREMWVFWVPDEHASDQVGVSKRFKNPIHWILSHIMNKGIMQNLMLNHDRDFFDFLKGGLVCWAYQTTMGHLPDDVIWLQVPECFEASYCIQYFCLFRRERIKVL